MVNRITSWLLLLLLPWGLWGQNIPEAQGFVNDFANLLSSQEETRLNAFLTRFAQETSNEIAVVIIDLPEGYTPEDYTYELATQWGVGSNAERDNGLVLAVFPNASKVRIEVGYGLEGAIPDLLAFKIIREVISPQFRQGNYFQGLSEAVQLLSDAAKGEFNEQDFNRRYYSQPRSSNEGGGGGGIILIIIIVAFIILARRGGGGGRGGGGRGGRGGGSGWLFFPLFFPGGGWGGGSGGWGGGGGFGGGDFGGFGGGGFGGGGATGDW